MILEDAKVVVAALLDRNCQATRDDGTTPATVLVTSEWYSDLYMDQNDAIITVGRIDDTVLPSGYGHAQDDNTDVVEVNVWTANKKDASGNQIVTDDILRWKLCQQISEIIRANENYPTYTPIGGSTPLASGIQSMRVRIFRDLDDPSKTPYPLRRTQFEVECFYQCKDLTS